MNQHTPRNYWLYAPGENARNWEKELEEGIMTLGYGYHEDLRNKTKDGITKELKNGGISLAKNTKDPTKRAIALSKFCREVNIGDLVFARNGKSKLIGCGIILSNYIYKQGESFEKHSHIRKIKWIKKEANAFYPLATGALCGPVKDENKGKYKYKLSRFQLLFEEEIGVLLSAPISQGVEDSNILQDVDEIKLRNLTETEKKRLINARCGQGQYREDIINEEKKCRVTSVDNTRFLIAGHIKPWRECSDEERLDRYNGLLLAPHVDKLFDKGYLSFEDDGTMLVAPVIETLCKIWHLDTKKNVGAFSKKQKDYLEWHRNNLYQKHVSE